MFQTARLYPVRANRFAPHTDTLTIKGRDLTGATLKMQVRDRPNGGQVRADLFQVTTAAAEGVMIASTAPIDGLPATVITWRINETTMEAMPLDPGDPGADVTLFFDLHITPAGGLKFVAAEGQLIVKAGVTE